jgi:hypothetical protein
MAEETYVDVSGAENTARKLARAADDFGEGIQELKLALARDYGCWSDDDIGKGFEDSYLKSAEKTQAGLVDLSKALTSFANKGLPSTIHQMQHLDAAYGDVMKKYASQLENYPINSDIGEKSE